METWDVRELAGLSAYRNIPEGLLVYVEYIEGGPHSDLILSPKRKFRDIRVAFLAYGITTSMVERFI